MKTKNIYSLPLREKDIQIAISDKKAHTDHMKYAIDFPIPEGTKILATKSGNVAAVYNDSNNGGYSKKYKDPKYLNSISIMHAHGEFSEYLHLKYKGAKVKKGDKVKTGQVIGLSGNTGYTTKPHLHFHVVKFDNSKKIWKPLEIRFKEKLKILKV